MKVTHKPSTSRITSQQQAVYQMVKQSGQHLTVEQIYNHVKKSMPRISLATIYRNADNLANRNLLRKVIIGQVARYEVAIKPHYHVVCLGCGDVDNIDSMPAVDIEEFFSRSTDYALTAHELIMYGLCPACQNKR